MMINEFEELTGFYPSTELYKDIEAAYMNFDGDKKAFCEAYKANKDGMADRIAIDSSIRAIKEQNDEDKKNEGLVREIEKLNAEIKRLNKELEKEQEWKPYEDEHNVKQADYDNLESDKFTKVLTDEEAASLIAKEFGFVENKINIIHEIDKEEISRHNQCRRNGKFVRKALFNAWDWNYIRFNVCGIAYEMHDGALKLFWW